MTFHEKLFRLRTGMNPFRNKTDFETVKTLSIIEALSTRALNFAEGANDPQNPHVVYEPERLLEFAEDYLAALERGEFPLWGLFTEPGMSMSDHSMIEKDGIMHMFYNRVPCGYPWWGLAVDNIGHATSEDLIHWKVEPLAFGSAPGRFDDCQTWSPAVIEKDGKYYMFYTGVNINVAQAPCLAVSDDLYHWESAASPLFTPGSWCPWDASHWSNGRDSMVFRDDDGTYYMYYCSSMTVENGVRDVMGMASSRDLLHWKDEGPTDELNTESASESPYVVKHNGKYYMFFTDCHRVGTGYAVSDNPLHGWKIKPGDSHMLMQGINDRRHSVCASEVFPFKGKWYFSYVNWRINELHSIIGFREFFWNDGDEENPMTVGKDLSEIFRKPEK